MWRKPLIIQAGRTWREAGCPIKITLAAGALLPLDP